MKLFAMIYTKSQLSTFSRTAVSSSRTYWYSLLAWRHPCVTIRTKSAEFSASTSDTCFISSSLYTSDVWHCVACVLLCRPQGEMAAETSSRWCSVWPFQLRIFQSVLSLQITAWSARLAGLRRAGCVCVLCFWCQFSIDDYQLLSVQSVVTPVYGSKVHAVNPHRYHVT